MRNKFKKFLSTISIISIGATLSIAPINFSLINNFIQESTNYSTSINDDENLTNQNDLVLDTTYKNDFAESPYGIAKIVGTQIKLTSYFNAEVWTYDILKNKSILLENNNNAPIKSEWLENIRIKYSPINNTYFVYGNINPTGDNNSNISGGFFFQIDAKTGNEFLIDNHPKKSLFLKKIDRLEEIVINNKTGNVIVITDFDKLTNQDSKVYVVNSYTYFIVESSLSAALSSLSFTHSDQKFANAFVVNDDIWGLTFVETSETSYKYKYLLFKFDLSSYGKSDEIEIGNTNNNNISKIYQNEIILNQPYIFEFNNSGQNKKYKIIQSFSNPIFNSSYTNEASKGSDYFDVFDINITSNTNNDILINSKNKNEYNINQNKYALSSMKADYKNKRLFVSLNPLLKGKVDYSKYAFAAYKFNNSNNVELGINSSDIEFNLYNKESIEQNKKIIPFISVINDSLNISSKSSIVIESVIYNVLKEESILESTQIFDTLYKRTEWDGTSNITWTNSEWSKFKLLDYKAQAEKSESKKKLPIDISENEIINWIKVIDETNAGYLLTNSLENMKLEDGFNISLSEKKLYNNETGQLKARVKSEIKKWWYESNDTSNNAKEIFYTDINLSIFGTVEKLKFELVTSPAIDQNKWNNISNNFLSVKKASSVTAKDIIDNFIKHGEYIEIKDSDIQILNDQNSSNAPEKKAITAKYNDTQGVLFIEYDLSSLSSDGMGLIDPKYISGSYTYSGFAKLSEYKEISLKINEFNEYKKTRLAYQFTISEILQILDYSPLFTDYYRWSIKFDHDMGSDEYRNNIMQGNANFILKYEVPSNMDPILKQPEYSEIRVSTSTVPNNNNNNVDGSGCLKLSDVLGTTITLEEGKANKITGNKNIEYVKTNIDSIIGEVVNIDKNWFNPNEFLATFNELKSTSNEAYFNLNFKDDKINTNIYVTKNGSSLNERLILDKPFIEEIKKLDPNPLAFNELKLNYDVLTFKWNFGISNDEKYNPKIDIATLSEQINDKELNSISFSSVLPTTFADYFKEDMMKFNEIYPLLKLDYDTEDKNDPRYFELTNLVIVGNDSDGIVNVKYELYYPNLSDQNRVIENPEITLTGFKSNGKFLVILIVVSSIIVFLMLTLVIGSPIYLTIKRHKFLSEKNNKKNNKLSKKFDKVK